ncbi:hypothetical protein GDO81_028960 [Engystomops pustulosus]|uniref:Fatty-acid amide hydrolase 1 n=1 Tax=Engystomops pustulosus TaxID=76066 RepID=A0AAV6ZL39_ENGPU|nr:hypothetical protein GDO81_028960 [Engystomops pustulosus]
MMQEKVLEFLEQRPPEWRLVASAGCVLAASFFGLRWRKRRQIQKRMEEERKRRAESERHMRRELRDFHKQNPAVDSKKILELPLLELIEKLKDDSLTPETVLYSYVEKALEVNDDLNCVTVFLTDCKEQLKNLRAERVRGPLYGVPVTIKEHVGYQGHPSTCGLVQYLDVLDKEDSVMVSVLKKQGAIVFAKTNVPQTLLCLGGVRSCIDGMTAVPLCIGPMARDVDSLVLSMKAFWCDKMFHLDPSIPPICFNEETFSSISSLRIGYYEEDGYFQPNPGMRRVLLEAKQLLEAAGHQLVPFRPPRVNTIYEMFIKAMVGDGGRTLADKFNNNVVDPNLADSYLMYTMPRVLKRLLGFLLRPIFPRISSHIYSACGPRSLKDHWAERIELEDYRDEFIREWRRLSLDVVLCPMLSPAFNIGYPGKMLAPLSYTMIYNILRFPAGVVPFGRVTAEDEEELKRHRGYNNDPWDKLFKKAVEDGLGMPLSVQCAALPYQDEICLRLMKEIETLHSRHLKR